MRRVARRAIVSRSNASEPRVASTAMPVGVWRRRRTRAVRAKDAGAWMTLSQELIDASQSAVRAAESKNADRLFTVGGDIYEACSHCHQKYMDAIVNANK